MILPLRLRPAYPADRPALLALWLRLTIQAHPAIPPGYWRSSLPWVRDTYLPQGQTWLALDGHRVCGFICILPPHLLGALFVAPVTVGVVSLNVSCVMPNATILGCCWRCIALTVGHWLSIVARDSVV
ncbi:putative acetyltransferase [Edwardsiella tarda]|nr:putative acetyltransferase [Edwardsiella tarda]